MSSDGGPGTIPGKKHIASAFRIDPASGALTPHGASVVLPSRPIHCCVDGSGRYLLTAFNFPSGITVHRIGPDGTFGEQVVQHEQLDVGIFAHQVVTTPGDKTTILVTRGNHPEGARPEDPGALKIYSFDNGTLSNLASIQPGNGLGFGPRHLDFHPDKPWVFVSVERQSQLCVYKLNNDGALSREPMFIANSLADRANAGPPQMAGAIHVHPNGRFVYQTNRNSEHRGDRRPEGVQRWRKQRRGVRHRPGQRRADARSEHRGPHQSFAHLRHRPERPAADRRLHPADGDCATARRCRPLWCSTASAPTAGSNSRASTMSTPAASCSSGPASSRCPDAQRCRSAGGAHGNMLGFRLRGGNHEEVELACCPGVARVHRRRCVRAQDYPTAPIHLVSGFPAGTHRRHLGTRGRRQDGPDPRPAVRGREQGAARRRASPQPRSPAHRRTATRSTSAPPPT